MRDLFREYLDESNDLMPFYAGRPAALFSRFPFPEKAQWPPTLVEELRTYNIEMGSQASFAGTELAVITGQQPGLFTGPLYTIFKALTAIKLAQKIEQQSGRRCVPIFWVASEDHDFKEAATAHFLTKKDEAYSLTYKPRRDVADLPLYRVPLEPWVHEAIENAARRVRKSEQAKEIASFLHNSASRSETLCEWTVRLLARMFKDTPLILFVPHLPAARALQADVLKREIQNPLESTRRLNSTGKSLEELGFQLQIVKSDDECNFFLEVEHRRRKVIYAEAKFRVPEERLDFDREELLKLLTQEPERFSPNVALRPVVQQRLFPAIAYVGGPSEVAYWGQLKSVFEYFEQPMPTVFPRIQCVLTTTKLKKLMRKLSLTVEDLKLPFEQLEQKTLRNTSQHASFQKVMNTRTSIEEEFHALESALKETDSVTSEMVGAVRTHLTLELERILDTLSRRNEEQVETTRKQVVRLQNALMPWRKPQERVYTVFSFLFEHGWDLVVHLLKEIDIESFQTQEVEL